MLIRHTLAMLFGMLLFQPASLQAQENSAIEVVQYRAVENFIRPGYKRFNKATHWLVVQTESLCKYPSTNALEVARSAFTESALAWGRVEFLRFGPALSKGRIERILYYQGGKYSGISQIKKVLNTQDKTAIDVPRLSKKSIAVQGLEALEFVLFAEGSLSLSRKNSSPFRCAYAKAIAGNLDRIAENMNKAWNNPDKLAGHWWSLGKTDKDKIESREALNRLLATLIHGLEVVRDARLRSIIRNTLGKNRASSALFYFSENTFPMIVANIRGFQQLYDQSGMASLVPESEMKMANSISVDFEQAIIMSRAFKGIFEKVLNDRTNPLKLDDLDKLLTSLIIKLDTQYAPAAGLVAGFAFSDGD